jgi:hypothetical protein
MVGATPTPGHGCSGRLWVTRCERAYLRGRGDTSPLFYNATCHLVPKRGYVRAPQSLDNARRTETQA